MRLFCCVLFTLIIACENSQSSSTIGASTETDTNEAGTDIDTTDTADADTEENIPEPTDEGENDQLFTDEDALSPDEPVYPAGNEAGFVEVAPRIFEDNTCHARSRMFYVFQSADESPEEKPLFVFFNGGPASPTSSLLFVINTSKYTADPVFTGGGDPVPNPNSWSTLGNLLYVDARQAGFSYELSTPGCTYNPLPDHIADAADFIETILGLFEMHPEIERNPVVLVGESWGGKRAATMLLMLLYYEQIPFLSTHERLEAHYRRIFPEYDGQTIPFSAILSQFIAQILIQPAYEDTLMSQEDIENDPALQYALDHQDEDPVHLLREKLNAGFDALMHLDTMGILLQSDPADIALMYATERTDAFRRDIPSDQQGDLALLYGTLKPNDKFFMGKGNTYGELAYALAVFLELIKLVPTMMTNARWDLYTVFVPGYPAAIRSSYSDRVSEVIVNEEEWIIRYISGEPAEVSVFVPRYLDSNHMVSASEPAKLLNDARRFMEERTVWQPTPLQK